jgi:hypothetical protein
MLPSEFEGVTQCGFNKGNVCSSKGAINEEEDKQKRS